MVRCYYFAYLANGGLIKNTIALNYVEAYAVLVGAGFINLSSLSGNLLNSVKNSILPQSLIDYIGTLKNNKSIKKGYFGIYTQIDTDAAKLAYATGAIFKDTNGNIFSETHDKTVGSGYYYNFHDAAHLIHVWYGNPI